MVHPLLSLTVVVVHPLQFLTADVQHLFLTVDVQHPLLILAAVAFRHAVVTAVLFAASFL
ncbi:hypothetical protein OAG71_02165 [bacterium]|nr:hypothetical protein [bacterium]